MPGGNVSGSGGSRVDRPAIPVKPSHLSPIVANGYKRSPSDLRPKLNSVTSKVNNSPASPLIAETKNGLTTAASAKNVKSAVGKKSELSEVENVRLNLHPVASNNNTNKIHAESGLAAKRAPSPTPTRGQNSTDSDNGDFEEEEGVKKISADSIQNIRRDANVMSFQFTGAASPNDGLSHLPGAAAPKTALSKKTEDLTARQSDSKKVGILDIKHTRR